MEWILNLDLKIDQEKEQRKAPINSNFVNKNKINNI